MSQSSISELENGNRKNVSVAEVIVLARALNTAPLCLIYPGPYSDVVQVLPGVDAVELWAAQWFAGAFPGVTDNPANKDSDAYREAVAHLAAAGLQPDDSDGPEQQAKAYRANTRALAEARELAALRQQTRGVDQQV